MNAAQIAEELELIATRIDRNTPRARDPEAFHVEKSELRRDVRAIAQWLRSERKPGA